MAEEEKEKQVKRVQSSVKLIRELLSPMIVEKKKFLWQKIVAAMVDITKTRNKETEDILVKLLEFEGRIPLAPESDIPGAMSPEDMLKSMAIQTLSEWTGRQHLKVFNKIYLTTQSPALRGIAKVYIGRLGGELMERKQ